MHKSMLLALGNKNILDYDYYYIHVLALLFSAGHSHKYQEK